MKNKLFTVTVEFDGLSDWWQSIGWQAHETAFTNSCRAFALAIAAAGVGFRYPGFRRAMAIVRVVGLGFGLYFKLAEIPKQEHGHSTRRNILGNK
mgnify:CR=1 FL=1